MTQVSTAVEGIVHTMVGLSYVPVDGGSMVHEDRLNQHGTPAALAIFAQLLHDGAPHVYRQEVADEAPETGDQQATLYIRRDQ